MKSASQLNIQEFKTDVENESETAKFTHFYSLVDKTVMVIAKAILVHYINKYASQILKNRKCSDYSKAYTFSMKAMLWHVLEALRFMFTLKRGAGFCEQVMIQ